MTTIEVTDPADPRLTEFTGLTDVQLRRVREPAEGLFLAEGEKVIRRAVQAGCAIRSVLAEQRWLDALADVLPDDVLRYTAAADVLQAVTGYHVHRGALAAVNRPPEATVEQVLEGSQRVVVIEDAVDPTNVGAVFRAAAALGLDGVLLSPRCADPLYRRAVKVSMAAVLSLPWARFRGWPEGIGQLHSAGFTVLALTPAPRAVALDQLGPDQRARCALMIGAEGPGLSQAALSRCDLLVRIPMSHGIDSLNLGAAAAVACYAVTR